MEYKNIYKQNYIYYDSGLLYGTFHPLGNIILEKEDNHYNIVNDTNDDTILYGEIDEYKLYKDVINYGRELYLLFKNSITHKIYCTTDLDPYTRVWRPITIFNSDSDIKKSFEICKRFVEKYNLPFDTLYYAVPRKGKQHKKISLLKLVNYLIVSFMIHTIFAELSDGYSKYPDIYKAFDIEPNLNNKEILKIIIKCHNSFKYLKNENIGNYIVDMIEENNSFIPIRYTNNLFTFVHEVITNNICTLSFYSSEKLEEINQYIVFRKCSICLSTINDEKETQIDNKKVPINRKIYCDECKQKAKKRISNKYEKSIRDLYDKIKSERQSVTNLDIISEIDNMPPKDKVTKTYLKTLLSKIEIEKNRDE